MKLRIAQVAPLIESVPPKLYGGTERVVSFLTEELVKQGHEVTLFASGDSKTKARLIPVCESSLRLDSNCEDSLAHHIIQLQMVYDMSASFDIIHYHTDYLHFPLSRLTFTSHITTLHGRLNIRDLQPLYKIYRDMPVISISLSQREPLSDINWVGNVYHGLPESMLKPVYSQGQYLAFVGRISEEKGLDKAIEIAKRCGIPLRIAAKIDKADIKYFETHIKHLLDHPLIDYVGEIGETEKNEFFGNALALLFPINWSEPFGLVMIEAMACGTPIVAFNRGSVPEIIEHGVNGYIASNVDEAVRAVESISNIQRFKCREVFESRFTANTMASGYLQLYEKQLNINETTYRLKLASL